MHTDALDQGIIRIARAFCKPRVVTDILRRLQQARAAERRLLRTSKGGSKTHHPRSPQRNTTGLADPSVLDQLLTHLQGVLDANDFLNMLLRLGDLFRDHGMIHRAEETYSTALQHATAAHQPGWLAEAYLRRGEVYCRQGRWKESSTDLAESRQIFTRLNQQVAVGRVENILATSYVEQGKLKQAQVYFERALATFDRHEQTHMAGFVLMNLGIVHNITSHFDVALAHYKRAQSHFEEVGDLQRLAGLHHNMGMSYLFKGAPQDALREFDAGAALAQRIPDVNLLGLANLGKSSVYLQLRDLTMALTLANQAIEAFTLANDRLSLADAYKVKGMIHREMRTYDFARSYFQTSLRMNLDMGNHLNAGETYVEMAVMEKRLGGTTEAIAALHRAREHFKKVGASHEVQRVDAELHNLKQRG